MKRGTWLAVGLVVATSGEIARADDAPAGVLSNSFVLRPLVLPANVWEAQVQGESTFFRAGDPLVVAGAGVRVGAPIINGLELFADPARFALSPHSEQGNYAPRGAITYRLSPWTAPTSGAGNPLPGSAESPGVVTGESRQFFELAVRLTGERTPVGAQDFFGSVSLPMAFRAPELLRVDVIPAVGLLAGVNQGAFATDVRASVQFAPWVWASLATGVSVPNLTNGDTTAIPLGAVLGFTVPYPTGPMFDIVAQAGFPELLLPAAAGDKTDTHTFQALLTLRWYSYWQLDAVDPQAKDVEAKKQRCGDAP